MSLFSFFVGRTCAYFDKLSMPYSLNAGVPYRSKSSHINFIPFFTGSPNFSLFNLTYSPHARVCTHTRQKDGKVGDGTLNEWEINKKKFIILATEMQRERLRSFRF